MAGLAGANSCGLTKDIQNVANSKWKRGYDHHHHRGSSTCDANRFSDPRPLR